jgi:gliding motility-associated-like protein
MRQFYLWAIGIFASFSIPFTGIAQLTVTATTPTQAVQDYLLGQGIQATNITYTGNAAQLGVFTCTNCNLGLPSGVVMSSGAAVTAAGPNNSASSSTSYGPLSSDPDLNAISAVSVYDACILQFDFVPTGDQFTFRFVFGSDEYPEFTNDVFNDSFGFFLSGPGISGPYANGAINIAQIPGTALPLTINNLNNGNAGTNGPCEYCQYYVHNGTGSQFPFNSSNTYIQADGFTTVIEAQASVQCGQTYRIKLAIGDGFDSIYNSWVFLEANSFSSNNLDVGFNQSQLAPSVNAVYEGCTGGSVTFTRPENLPGDVTFNVTYSGTAINGVDYAQMPATIFFPNGVNQVTIPFTGLPDAITEGQETVILTVEAPVACASTATLNLFINEVPPLTAAAGNVQLDCDDDPQVSVAVGGGLGQYTVQWNTGVSGTTIPVPYEAATYTYTVSDVCGTPPVTGTVTTTLTQYAPLVVDIGSDQQLTCLDLLSITPTVSGGGGGNTFEWFLNDQPYSATPTFSWQVNQPAEISVTVTDVCGIQASDVIGITLPEVPVLVDLGEDINAECFTQLNVGASVSGGVGNTYQYNWSLEGQSIGSSSTVQFVPGPGGTLTLTATDQCGNIGTDDVEIIVEAEPVDVVLPQDLSGTCLDVLTITPDVSGGSGGYQYTWQADGINAGSGSTLDIQLQDGLSVTLSVVDQCGGEGQAETVLSVPPVPVTVSIGPDPLVNCLSEVNITPVVSGGVGAYSYEWSVSGTEAGEGATLTVEAVEGIQVSLLVNDECGNSASDELEIGIIPTPVNIDMQPVLNVNCLEDFTLSPDVTGGTGALEYVWTSGDETIGEQESLTLNTTSDLVISLQVSDICGNVAVDVINIELNPVVISLDITPDVAICPGESAELNVTASGGIGNYAYEWNTGASAPEIEVTPAADQVYTVEVTDACSNEASASVTVDVLIPQNELQGAGNTELCLGVLSGGLFSGGVEPVSVTWAADSLDYNGIASFTGLKPGTSEVVIRDFCENEVRVDVTIIGCEITIPNIFSPNGDGENQAFVIDGLTEAFPGSELIVYNRWGAVVYEDSNYRNDWEGDDLPEGTYYYILKRSDGEKYSGYVMIVR